MKNPSAYPTQEEVIQAIQARETGLDNPGFCLACGDLADGCEPDAHHYECEACGAHAVFGAEEVLLMGAFKP